MVTMIYLHGLLSSSLSTKGKFIQEKMESLLPVITPDFYPDREQFERMNVTVLIDKVQEWVSQVDGDIILAGSSFGGLVAIRYLQIRGEGSNKVKGLVILAPALGFQNVLEQHLIPREEWISWQRRGFTLVEHPAWSGKTKWSWNFVQDLQKHHLSMDEPLTVPVLLIHGEMDDVIPVGNSRSFAEKQEQQGSSWECHYLPGAGHQMLDHLPAITDTIKNWLDGQSFL